MAQLAESMDLWMMVATGINEGPMVLGLWEEMHYGVLYHKNLWHSKHWTKQDS